MADPALKFIFCDPTALGCTMAAHGKEDDVLEDFFASLDIADDSVEDGEVVEVTKRSQKVDSHVPSKNEANSRERDSSTSTSKHNSKKYNHSQKESIIGRAEEAKSSWTEFNIEKEKSSSAPSGSKPISFSLNPKGKKAKKKKSKTAATKPSAAGQDSAANEEMPCTATKIDNHQRPLWTAVVDTCSLVDDGGECVRELIELAKAAQFRADMYGASLDEIRIVIPHVLWSELDGITKRPKSRTFLSQSNSDELERAQELARKARKAIRMLRDRMEMESMLYQTGRRVGGNINTTIHHRRIVAQTVKEMKNSSEKFLPPSSEHVNDDHILACALASAAKDTSKDTSPTAPRPAGGTVLLTNDHILSCKAISNGIRVFSIKEFLRHISLRSEVRKDLLKKQRPPDYGGFTY